jgi:hypothetical protein
VDIRVFLTLNLSEGLAQIESQFLENFGDNLKIKLQRKGLVKPEEFQGCTETEIEELCKSQGVSYLPVVYRSFLLIMGKNTGNYFMRDLDHTYHSVLNLKEVALGLSEGDNVQLPEDAFVFVYDGGGYFAYFETERHKDNPPVSYGYFSNKKPILALEAESLSEFFDQQLQWYESVLWNPLVTGKGLLGNIKMWMRRRLSGFLYSISDK